MTSKLSILVLFAALMFCSCQAPPRNTALIRPEIKLIDYTDVQRMKLVTSKTQFRSSDTIALCIRGFSGRTVTVELWEQKRGLVNKQTQMIHAPHVRTGPGGVGYDYSVGYAPSGRRAETQVETDYVLYLPQLPPGAYEVRLTSNDGIYLQSTFAVSK